MLEQENTTNMKIRFAYIPEESEDAERAVTALRRIFPLAAVRKSSGKPPFLHLYLTTKMPETPCGTRKKH